MRSVVVLAIALAACNEPRERLPDACVDCALRIHSPQINDLHSAEFHGRVLARHGYDFAICQNCHGADFAGGIADVSCLGCHPQGPTTCETCHGPAGLSSVARGAHPPHLAAGLDCTACHVEPASWDAPGHILGDAPPAEVTFGAGANVTPGEAQREGPPTWDGRACTNVYCHGDVTPSFGGRDTEPRWAEASPAFTCDRCHGAPPPDHLRVDCTSCHPRTASEHANGVVDVL